MQDPILERNRTMAQTGRLKGVNWPTLGFIVGYHLALLIGLPFYFYYSPPGAGLIIISIILLFLTEIGIGAAYHRYYAHRAYHMSKPAEAVLLFLGNMATQGSVLTWAHDHRLHHSFVDTDRDPYSIKKGFWYAHILWMFHKPITVEKERVPDLMENRLVMFQDRHHFTLSLVTNALVCGAIGWAIGDYLGAFVLAWWTRLFVSHHFTWFVNSLCHTWGDRSFSREQSAVDNYVLAFLTVGEGYHNYHHTFASDYRNGFRWFHFDPSKWVIWGLSKVGLARDLTRFDQYRIHRRLLSEDRKLLLETLREKGYSARCELEQTIIHLADGMKTKLARIAELSAELKRHRRARSGASALSNLQAEFNSLRRSLHEDWKAWTRMCSHVLDVLPVPA
ncbi:MAG: fatty acid desaturase [Acidobacteria bacterium]|nr:fatty acid desaturase [Acidobacteriota bacterium]